MADDFDPDGYLASKRPPTAGAGFDPDTYLSQKTRSPVPTGPGPWRGGYAAPAAERPAPPHAGPWAKGYEPPPGGFPKPSLAPSADDVADYERQPFYTKGWRIMTGQTPEMKAAQRFMEHEVATRPELQAMLAGEKAAAGVGASAIGGAVAAEAIGARMAPYVAQIPGRVQRYLAPALADAAGAGVGGTTGALVEGASVPDALKAGAESVVPGFAFGAGIRTAAAAAQGTSNLLRSNRWIGEYARANEAGTYGRPEVKALSAGEPGIQEAADQAQQRIATRNATKLSQAGRTHGADIDAALTSQPEHDVKPVVDRLYELSQANRTARTGRVRDPELESAVSDAFDLMDVDAKTGTALGEDLIATRRTLDKKSEWGQPETKDNRAYREIYRAFNDALHGQPGDRSAVQEAITNADRAYATQRGESERLNDIVFGTEEGNVSRGVRDDGTPDIRAPKERTAAARLRRIGDDTVAGSVEARQLAEVRAMDPEYARQLENVLAVKAREATSPGSVKVPTNLPRLLQFPGAPFLEQNARAIGARVLEPAATATADALLTTPVGPVIAEQNAIVRARQAERDAERRRASQLLGRRGAYSR